MATHGKKVLPGVAQSTLKKIMPTLIAEMSKNAQRIGGTWVLTRLADPAKTGGRLGLGSAAANTGKLGVGAFFSAFFIWLSMENTCQAAEIPRPIREEVDLDALGLTDEELLELSESLEGTLSERERAWLEESYQRRLQREQELIPE